MDERAARTFGEALAHLKATLHPRDRGPYSLAEIGAGTGISRQHIHNMIQGRRGVPKDQHVRAIADFFGVPAEYFFDPELAEKVDRELEAVIEHRDNDDGGRQLAQRVMDLSPRDRQTITDLVQKMQDYEGRPRERRSRRKPEEK